MSKAELVADNGASKPEKGCTENVTQNEKSTSRTLAFSIDKIMSSETKGAPSFRLRDRTDTFKRWKTVDGINGSRRQSIYNELHAAMTPEEEVVANRRHRSKPEVVLRNDAIARYHLQKQQMKIANTVMLHVATGSGMASEVGGGLLPVMRRPELLFRQYHERHPYHLQSSVHAERYRPNATDMTSRSVDPVAPSVGRCRLPVFSDVTWSPSNRGSDYVAADKSKFAAESYLSPARPTLWRKPHGVHYQHDVIDWSQMAAGSLQRRRPSPTDSPQSVISGCSAKRDEEEIVVDDDVDDRKQFSPTSEFPVERQEAVNDGDDSSPTGKTGDADVERLSAASVTSSSW